MPVLSHRFRVALLKAVFRRLLRTPCPDRILRKEETIGDVNFYSVWIVKTNDTHFLVKSIDDEKLSGVWFCGEMPENNGDVFIGDLRFKEVEIRHYYRWATIEYKGIVDYLVTGLTRFVHLKYWAWYFREWLAKSVFNRRQLIARDRYELLKILVDRHVSMKEDEFESLQLMTDLYSFRWYGHPEGMAQYRAFELHLDSLVESGELKKSHKGTYSVTGVAIKSLREDEYAERRHKDSLSVQRKMFWITVLLVLTSIIQAGLIKLSPVIDFTKPASASGSSPRSPD